MIAIFWTILAVIIFIISYSLKLNILIKNKFTQYFFILSIPMLSLVTYLWLSSYNEFSQYYNAEQINKRIENNALRKIARELKIEEVKYKVKLQIEPNNIEYYWKLANLYIPMKRVEDAIEVLEKALIIEPKNLDVLSLYISQNLKNNEGFLSSDLLSKLDYLKDNPKYHTIYHSILAMYSYAEKNYLNAEKYWKIVLKHSENFSKEYIASIEKLLNKIAFMQKTYTVSVKVEIDENIKFSNNDTVFVYAKTKESNTPLAVVKRKAKFFPLTLALNVEDSMLKDWNLDIAEEFYIEVKVSKNDKAEFDKHSKTVKTGIINKTTNKVSLLLR